MDSKPWYESLTEWGIIALGIFALALPIFGKADYATFLQEEQAGVIEWIGLLGSLISGAVAFYGRFRAVTKLTT
jgi:hypothetical protein